jgi:hypothetical protein
MHIQRPIVIFLEIFEHFWPVRCICVLFSRTNYSNTPLLSPFWDRILGPVLGIVQCAQRKERQLAHFQGSTRTKEGRPLEVVRHFGSIDTG